MKFRNKTHQNDTVNVPGPGSYGPKDVMSKTSQSLGKDSRFKHTDAKNVPSPANYNPPISGIKSPEIRFGEGMRGEYESPTKLNTPGPGTYEHMDTMDKTLYSFGNKSTYNYNEVTPGPDHQNVPEQPQ